MGTDNILCGEAKDGYPVIFSFAGSPRELLVGFCQRVFFINFRGVDIYRKILVT